MLAVHGDAEPMPNRGAHYSRLMPESAAPVPLQISFVVPDADEAVRIWHAQYGVGPWTLVNLTPDDPQVDGRHEPYAFRTALAPWGPVQLELIQPLDDRSHYARSLAAHDGKAHLHHIKLSSEDYQDAYDAMLASGHRVIQSGQLQETSFAYFTLGDAIGCAIERTTLQPGQPAGFLMGATETYPPQ